MEFYKLFYRIHNRDDWWRLKNYIAWLAFCKLTFNGGNRYMDNAKHYGIWNTCKKEFQFGIDEPSKTKALKKLFSKIGNDARKWRFVVREIR